GGRPAPRHARRRDGGAPPTARQGCRRADDRRPAPHAHPGRSRTMNAWERIRTFWRRAPEPDHPLTEAERDAEHPDSAYDGLAREVDAFVGDDLDPDERGAARG